MDSDSVILHDKHKRRYKASVLYDNHTSEYYMVHQLSIHTEVTLIPQEVQGAHLMVGSLESEF